MRIKCTKDILDKKDEIFAKNTAIQNQIQRYEKDGNGRDKPNLEPMIVNFNPAQLRGKWNNCIFLLFVEKLEEEGYHDVNENNPDLPEDEFIKVRDAFFKRLTRFQTELNKHRPREGEHPEDAEEQIERANTRTTSANRKNGRRKQVSSDFIVFIAFVDAHTAA